MLSLDQGQSYQPTNGVNSPVRSPLPDACTCALPALTAVEAVAADAAVDVDMASSSLVRDVRIVAERKLELREESKARREDGVESSIIWRPPARFLRNQVRKKFGRRAFVFSASELFRALI